jgi:hypothetical protein
LWAPTGDEQPQQILAGRAVAEPHLPVLMPARTDKNSSERRLFMRRRKFIGLVGGAAAWPLTAGAQQRAVWDGAVIYWVGRQSYEPSDRGLCCLCVAPRPRPHRLRALFAEGLDRRSGAPLRPPTCQATSLDNYIRWSTLVEVKKIGRKQPRGVREAAFGWSRAPFS